MEETIQLRPRCHNTPMTLNSSGYESWHECGHCGHITLDSEDDCWPEPNRTLIRADNTSGYRGVTLAHNGKWRAQIGIGGVSKNLGHHVDILDAAKAYSNASQSI